MPWYRITITDIYGHLSQGIRFDAMDNIDAYYGKARRKAEIALKNKFRDIDVVMLVSSSKEVQDHLEKERSKTTVVYDPAKIKEELDKSRASGKYSQYVPSIEKE